MTPVRTLIVDPSELVRKGIRKMLLANEGVMVVGETANAGPVIKAVDRLSLGLVICDLEIGSPGGISMIARLCGTNPKLRVAVFTAQNDPASVSGAFEAGARAYVLKQSPVGALNTAVAAVIAGAAYVDPMLPTAIRVASGRSFPGELTDREKQVIVGVALGYLHKEIAAILHVSIKTVDAARARAEEKIGGHHRTDLVRYVMQQGWFVDDILGPYDSRSVRHN